MQGTVGVLCVNAGASVVQKSAMQERSEEFGTSTALPNPNYGSGLTHGGLTLPENLPI